jgi:hypothetical protein
MGLRFSTRRFKICPGVRLNVGLGGLSTSFGTKGAWLTVGRKGIRTTTGIPGTGVYWTEQHNWDEVRAVAPELPAPAPEPGRVAWGVVIGLGVAAFLLIALLG